MQNVQTTPGPTPRRTPARRLLAVVGLAVAAATLTGCAGLQPGAAVVVDDRVVTDDRVDVAAEALCEYVTPQLEQAQQSLPLSEVRRSAAVLLTLRAATEQLAETYGAAPTADVNRELERIEELAGSLPDELQEAFVEVQGAQVYVPTVLSQVGAAALAAEGTTDPDAAASTAAGLRLLVDFLREHEVEFAPSLGLAVEAPEVPASLTAQEADALIGSLFVPADSSASVPFTDVATAASGAPLAAADSLPADQRCG